MDGEKSRTARLAALRPLSLRPRSARSAARSRRGTDTRRGHRGGGSSVQARPELAEFKRQFEGKFQADAEVGGRVWKILEDFFRAPTAPGYLLYEEYLAANLPAGRETQAQIREESALAHRILQRVLPETSPRNER